MNLPMLVTSSPTSRAFYAGTLVVCLLAALAVSGRQAQAEKVGVAAAVNPDAFSGSGGARKQLRIGKSIFYNERISTDASGVVQVLLVDGSTFTVGKNSDLVIDKFVYNPRKDTGEIVSTFSKGSMRYIGGKISKKPGGVKVNTPDGSLAIRGGMFQGSILPGGSIFSFLYGEDLTYTGRNGRTQTVYQTGYTLDLSSGTPTIRPTTPADIQLLMAALSNGAPPSGNVQIDSPPPPQRLAETLSLQQLIADATATRIDGELLQQLLALQNQDSQPEIRSTLGGYGAGLISDYAFDYGFAASTSPSDYTFNENSNVVTLGLHDIEGGSSIQRGVLSFDAAGSPNANLLSVSLFDPNDQPIQVISATGFIVSEPGHLCSGCDFMKWGEFGVEFTYLENGMYQMTEEIGLGWWVAGNVTHPGDLPQMGSAAYSGTAIGTIAVNGSPNLQTGRGDLGMNWNFAQRSGTLRIRNFDVAGGKTPLNVSGRMTMPGSVNRFTGNLAGTVGQANASGGAIGSFVKNGKDPAAGVIGNWGVAAGLGYRATGIFGARR